MKAEGRRQEAGVIYHQLGNSPGVEEVETVYNVNISCLEYSILILKFGF
jgi:hypothetical protein